MNAQNQKTKLDPFYLVLIFAALAGTFFAVFIFKTARPQAVKLIRWSPVASYNDVFDSIHKRQYPLLKNTYNDILVWNADKLSLSAEDIISSIYKVTQVSAKPADISPEVLKMLSHLQNEKSKTPQNLPLRLVIQSPTLVAQRKKLKDPKETTLKVNVDVYYFMSFDDINPEEFYDPKALKKALAKASTSPHLFTAYQKDSSSIQIDVISLKTN